MEKDKREHNTLKFIEIIAAYTTAEVHHWKTRPLEQFWTQNISINFIY